jgi:hypothetical protein
MEKGVYRRKPEFYMAGSSGEERKMKKSFVLGAAVVARLSMAGCASASGRMSRGLSGVPDFVNEAYLGASEDVIIGIGTYRIGNDMSKMGTGKTFAETRARAGTLRGS